MIIKKKLRDLTFEEYKDWKLKNCTPIKTCTKCEFGCVTCSWFPNEKTCWVNNKDSYSDKFLNQETEIEIDILDKVEKEYLGNVIRPFKNRVRYIIKENWPDLSCTENIAIAINSIENSSCISTEYIAFPIFKQGTMYKNMQVDKQYTLEELGLFLEENKNNEN